MSGAALPVDLDILRGWLDAQGVGGGPIEEATPLTGGTQNILVRFRRGRDVYVLRRPPATPRDNSNETMRREARVLRALRGTRVPHPELIAACGDESVIGAAFYVMRHVEGVNVTSAMPALHAGSEDIRRGMGLALVEGIAELAACDYRALGLEGFGKPEGYLQRQVSRWRSQLESYGMVPQWTGSPLPGAVGEIAGWLDGNLPDDFRPGIIHGDYHLGNVLFRPEGAELAAIVDWELSTIGDPLLDLAWLVATWPDESAAWSGAFEVRPWRGFPDAVELVARYTERTGRDLKSLDWYLVLAKFKLAILLEGTHVRACAGKAPKDVGDRLHAGAIGLFDRALDRIRKVG